MRKIKIFIVCVFLSIFASGCATSGGGRHAHLKKPWRLDKASFASCSSDKMVCWATPGMAKSGDVEELKELKKITIAHFFLMAENNDWVTKYNQVGATVHNMASKEAILKATNEIYNHLKKKLTESGYEVAILNRDKILSHPVYLENQGSISTNKGFRWDMYKLDSKGVNYTGAVPEGVNNADLKSGWDRIGQMWRDIAGSDSLVLNIPLFVSFVDPVASGQSNTVTFTVRPHMEFYTNPIYGVPALGGPSGSSVIFDNRVINKEDGYFNFNKKSVEYGFQFTATPDEQKYIRAISRGGKKYMDLIVDQIKALD